MSKRYDKESLLAEGKLALAKGDQLAQEVSLKEWNDKEKIDKLMGVSKVSLPVFYYGTVLPELRKLIVKDISSRDLDFEDSTLKRMRYRGEWRIRLWEGQALDVAYAAGFYWQQLRNCGIFLEFDIRDMVASDLLAKKTSEAAFLHGEAFSPDYMYYCHIKRLRDYKERVNGLLFAPEVDYWLKEKSHWWHDGQEQSFKDVFTEECSLFVNEQTYKKPKLADVTLWDWLSNRMNWANSGSGYVVGLDEGKVPIIDVKMKKTKWYDAWTIPLEVLYDAVRYQVVGHNKVLQKPELEKVRGVIGADLITYLRMKFIWDKALSGFFEGTDFSPLYMSSNRRMNMWVKLAQEGDWNLPLDQSEFDQMQTKEMVMILWNKLNEKVCTVDQTANFIFTKLIASTNVAKIHLPFQGKDADLYEIVGEMDVDQELKNKLLSSMGARSVEWDYTNGVMSGWYWTAFTDTLLNVITYRCAKRLVMERWHMWEDAKVEFMQGDDDAITTSSYLYANLLSLAYAVMGFKVNRAKFFISKTRQEFLRRVVTDNSVRGYPARSVANLLFASPEKELKDDETVASSRLSMWHRFASRLMKPMHRLPWARDISQATKESKHTVLKWAYTPKGLGGGGLHNMQITGDGISANVIVEQAELIPPTKVWDDFKRDWQIEDDTLFNGTTVRTKGRKKAMRTTFKPVDILFKNKLSSISLNRYPETFEENILHTPRYEYEARIGKLGQYTMIDPINKDTIDNLLLGFTRKLKEYYLNKGLDMAVPLYEGWSEEFTSVYYSYQMAPLFTALKYRRRSTLIDMYELAHSITRTPPAFLVRFYE